MRSLFAKVAVVAVALWLHFGGMQQLMEPLATRYKTELLSIWLSIYVLMGLQWLRQNWRLIDRSFIRRMCLRIYLGACLRNG